MSRNGPPYPKFHKGPNCNDCSYRSTSFGYAPEEGSLDNASILFLLEALGSEEVAQGCNAVGPTGSILNQLLINSTPIRRSEQVVANTVRCWPVQWEAGRNGKQVPSLLDYNKNYIGIKPSPGQVRECASRYTDQMLKDFKGKYIIALGKVALEYMLEKPTSIQERRGTTFEPGTYKDCEDCFGKGFTDGKQFKCKSCGGRGTTSCLVCRRKTKHLRGCTAGSFTSFLPCEDCNTTGLRPPIQKKCKECATSGRVPSDPENPYVCERLKEGQLLFATYHPAALPRNPSLWSVVERDFSRIAHLDEELVEDTSTVCHIYPEDGSDDELLRSSILSIDIETTGSLDPAGGDIRCIAATHKIGEGYVYTPGDERVGKILSAPKIVGQNFVLFDWWWLHHHGHIIPKETSVVDTRFLGKLINPDTPNDLVYLTAELAEPSIRGYWKTRQNYHDNIERVGCIDVDSTLRVERGAWKVLERNGQAHIGRDYIIPLSRVAFEMRLGGMKIDKGKMEIASREIKSNITALRGSLPDWGGVRSEDQHLKVQEHLYSTLELPVQKKNGRPTGGSQALEELSSRLETNHCSIDHLSEQKIAEASAFTKLISNLRDMSKLESSFLRYKLSDQDYVRPEINPLGTATLRPVYKNPNCVQVPPSARGMFIPDEKDWEVMSVDLKQAEVVGFLWFAEEWKTLKKILLEGYDVHDMTAEATGLHRDDAKGITFSILFGQHERTTAAKLGKTLDEIREITQTYYKALPGVPDYRKQMIHSSRERGFVESPFKVRRYIRATRSTGKAANQACNAPIQNIPPMVTGKAMIKIHRDLPSPARLWLWQHDEICVVYPKHLRGEVHSCVVDNLRSPVAEMSAPQLGMAAGLVFGTDVEVGPDWGRVRKLAEVEAIEKIGGDPWI